MNKTKSWDLISRFLTITAILLGAFYFVFSNFINVKESSLEFNILTNTGLIDIDENISKLTIKYDSINFLKQSKNISLTIIEVKNTGNKSILTNEYDHNIPFGIKIRNASLINLPQITTSSDINYFKDIISKVSDDKILFKKKIIDSKESFQIKFYTIHEKNIKPEFDYLGKISGIKNIKIIEPEKSNQEKSNETIFLEKATTILSIALITILSLLTLSLYKNNNIRMKSNTFLLKKIKELESEIDKKSNKQQKKHN